ncbi:sigma factor-like helix-turn-helix DNA-binding protein [Streptomyces sp. NPDC005808]|uniref:RNA polymerase sigma factor n=1 Tax=Streptomyces sp. NPDC005808 TaxID=3364734 RepID=UPI0036B93EE9
MNLNETQLGYALDGDADAITGILKELEGLIRARARRISLTHTEDLRQVGREAAWRCISRFNGVTVEHFIHYVAKTVTGAMNAAHCAMRYQGISVTEASLWRSAVKHANGDFKEAERLLQSGELTWRMSPATAEAVRIAVCPTAALPEDLAAPLPAECSESATRASAARVRLLLMDLGPKQRAVIQMTYGIGEHRCMSDGEIGAALGIGRAQVPSTRSKALKRLREDGLGAWLYR